MVAQCSWLIDWRGFQIPRRRLKTSTCCHATRVCRRTAVAASLKAINLPSEIVVGRNGTGDLKPGLEPGHCGTSQFFALKSVASWSNRIPQTYQGHDVLRYCSVENQRCVGTLRGSAVYAFFIKMLETSLVISAVSRQQLFSSWNRLICESLSKAH